MAEHKPLPYLEEEQRKIRANLKAWAEITSMVLELRKAELRTRRPSLCDDELKLEVWAELRRIKEQKWNHQA